MCLNNKAFPIEYYQARDFFPRIFVTSYCNVAESIQKTVKMHISYLHIYSILESMYIFLWEVNGRLFLISLIKPEVGHSSRRLPWSACWQRRSLSVGQGQSWPHPSETLWGSCSGPGWLSGAGWWGWRGCGSQGGRCRPCGPSSWPCKGPGAWTEAGGPEFRCA